MPTTAQKITEFDLSSEFEELQTILESGNLQAFADEAGRKEPLDTTPVQQSAQTAIRLNKNTDELPEELHEATGGIYIEITLTGTDPYRLKIVAENLIKTNNLNEEGHVLHVLGDIDGTNHTLTIKAWTKNPQKAQGIIKQNGHFPEDGVLETVQATRNTPRIGKIAGHVIFDSPLKRRAENASDTSSETITNLEERKLPRHPKTMLEGQREEAEVAVVTIMYDTPEELAKIVEEANVFGATVLPKNPLETLIVFVGEKKLAAAVELSKEIQNRLPNTKIAVTARPLYITYVDGHPVVTGEILKEIKKLKGVIMRTHTSGTIIDRESKRKLEIDPRLQTEVTVTTEKITGAKTTLKIVAVEAVPGKLVLAGPKETVGRDIELAVLRSFIDATRDYDKSMGDLSSVRVKAVIGKAGMGKTRVLADVKGEDGIYVTASPTHTLKNGWFLRQFIKELTHTAKTRGTKEGEGIATRRVEEDFFERALFAEIQTGCVEDFLQNKPFNEDELCDTILRLINNVARNSSTGRQVIELDNLEAADEESARVIGGLLRKNREEMPHVAFLLAGRTGSGEEIPNGFVSWFSERAEEKPLEITALTLTETAEDRVQHQANKNCVAIVKGIFDAEETDIIDERLLLWIAERSSGVPLSVIEICRTILEIGAVKRLSTGTWTFTTENLKEIEAIADPTSESIVAARLERLLVNASPALQKTFATILALGSINEKLKNTLVAENMIDEKMLTRLQNAGVIACIKNEEYEFTHPLFLEKGKRFVDPKILQQTNAELAEKFHTWRQSTNRREASEKGLTDSGLYGTIFDLAEAGNVTDLIKAYAPMAARTLLERYANNRCAEVALLGSKKMEGDPTCIVKQIELKTIAAEALTRIGNYPESHTILTKLWNFLKETTISLESMPRVSSRIILLLCKNGYMQGGTQGCEILRTGIQEWEREKTRLPENQEDLIAMYKGYLAYREGDYQTARQIFSEVNASDMQVAREIDRMRGMTQYDRLYFGGKNEDDRRKTTANIGDQETITMVVKDDVELQTEFEKSAVDLEKFAQAIIDRSIDVPDRKTLPNTFSRIGFIKMVQKDFPTAVRWAERGCRAAITAGLPVMIAKAYGMLGDIYLQWGKADEAVKAYTTANTYASSARSAQKEWPVSCHNLARGLQRKGGIDNKEKAIELSKDALRGMAMECFRDRLANEAPAMNNETQQTLTELINHPNPPTEMIDHAINVAVKDSTMVALPESEEEPFPTDDMAFYALNLLGEIVTDPNSVPDYIKLLATYGKRNYVRTMRNVNASNLPKSAQEAAIKNLQKKQSALHRIAA